MIQVHWYSLLPGLSMMKIGPSDLKASGDLALADSATTWQHSCTAFLHSTCACKMYRHTKQPPIAFNILTLECDQIFVAAFDDFWCSIGTVVWWVPSKAKLDCGPLATPDVIVDLIITSPHSPNLLVFLSIFLNYLR